MVKPTVVTKGSFDTVKIGPGHTKWSEIKHKSTPEQREKARQDAQKRGGYSPTGGPKNPKAPQKPIEYEFKKRKRKDLINAMQIIVFSMTNAELDKKLRKELEEAVEGVIKAHKDNQALAYTIVKE